jgi:putative hydrolase of the HAD superfamily
VVDDSDELERARRGLPTKEVARAALFSEGLRAAHPQLSVAAIDAAYAQLQARFRVAWKEQQTTPPVAVRLGWGLEALGLAPPPGWSRVIDEFESMEVEIAPQPVPHVVEALSALAARYRLGIISDTIITPGRGLRTLLDRMGVGHLFSHHVFSDEVGKSKPAPRVFALACAGLDVRPSGLLHVGDREQNDVMGPILFGARAALYTGVVDRGSASTAAQLVIDDLRALPELVDALT